MSQVTAERHLWGSVILGLRGLARRLFHRDEAGAVPAAVGRERVEMLSLAVAVCTTIFVMKAVIAYRDLDNADVPPYLCDGSYFGTLARVWVCCAEDFAVGVGCLLTSLAALRLAPGRWGRRAVRLLAHAAAAAALCLLVVNAQLFHVVRHFLTWDLVRLAGGFKLERSVTANAGLSVKLALALVPTLALAAHLWLVRAFPRFWAGLARHAARPVVLALALAALVGVAQAAQHGLITSERPGDFARNPLVHFARSLFLSPAIPVGSGPADEDDMDDFRPGRPGHTPGLLPRPPKNVIVISGESVGSHWLETYGCPMPTTPNLRRLDAEGKSLTFENFYATANHTIASAMPLFGATYNDTETLATVIDHEDFPTPGVPAALQKQGYTTAFFGSGGWSAWEGYRNIDDAFTRHGFDIDRDPANPFWQSQPKPDAFLDEKHLDAATFADLRRAVREMKGKKFAIWAWTYEAHNPYFDGAGPTFDRKYFPASVVGRDEEAEFERHLKAIWRLDALIGDLCRELEDLGLADDTLIVLTGDHGEAWGEHGFFRHGDFVFEQEVRVPLVLINPRLGALGRRSEVLGSHVDLWATVTDVCALPFDPRWQGRSLVSGGPEGRRAYTYRQNQALGVREGRYKYVWDLREGCERLYDVEDDPMEKRNLVDEQPDLCARLNRRVRAWATFQSRLTKERLAEVGK